MRRQGSDPVAEVGRRAPARAASAFASSSRSCTSAAQAAPASSTSARNTRWSPATRAGVRGRGRRARGRLAHLQHRHAHAALGALRQRLAQERAVAVALEVERRSSRTLVVAGELAHPVGRVHHRRRCRTRRRCGSAAPRRPGQRVHRHVAALRHQRHGSRLERRAARRPTSRAPEQRHDAVPVRAAHGQRVAQRDLAQPPLVLDAQRHLAEARAVHDGAAAAERARLVDARPAHRRGRDAHDHRVRHAPAAPTATGSSRTPCADERARVHAPDRPGEARAAQVEQRLARVRVVALARADDGDRSAAAAAGRGPSVQRPLHARGAPARAR